MCISSAKKGFDFIFVFIMFITLKSFFFFIKLYNWSPCPLSKCQLTSWTWLSPLFPHLHFKNRSIWISSNSCVWFITWKSWAAFEVSGAALHLLLRLNCKFPERKKLKSSCRVIYQSKPQAIGFSLDYYFLLFPYSVWLFFIYPYKGNLCQNVSKVSSKQRTCVNLHKKVFFFYNIEWWLIECVSFWH